MAKSAANASIMFEWEGKNSTGNKQKGFTTAPNSELVKAKLRRQGNHTHQDQEKAEGIWRQR